MDRDDDFGETPAPQDVLDGGGRGPEQVGRLERLRARHPWLVRVVLGAVAGLAVVVAVGTGVIRPTVWVQRVTLSPAAPQPSVTAGPSVQVVALRQVKALAGRSGPLTDYVRQTAPFGACAVVAPGQAPVAAIERVLDRALPGLRVTGVSRVLDPYSGLCSVQLRAGRPDGLTVAVLIASPSSTADLAKASVQTGRQNAGIRSAAYATVLTGDGWSVLVGATGSSSLLPSTTTLRSIVMNERLRW